MHTFAARLWVFVKPCRVRTYPGWVRLTLCQAWRLRGSCFASFQTVFSSNLSNKFVLGCVALLTSLNTSSRPPNVLPPSGCPLIPLISVLAWLFPWIACGFNLSLHSVCAGQRGQCLDTGSRRWWVGKHAQSRIAQCCTIAQWFKPVGFLAQGQHQLEESSDGGSVGGLHDRMEA